MKQTTKEWEAEHLPKIDQNKLYAAINDKIKVVTEELQTGPNLRIRLTLEGKLETLQWLEESIRVGYFSDSSGAGIVHLPMPDAS